MASATAADGSIYVLGGYAFSSPPFPPNIVERYDPNLGFWARRPDMPTARQGPAAATGRDGRIYAIGGYDGLGSLASVEAYDPATDTWTFVASMSVARSSHAAATGADGRIYAVAGEAISVEVFTLDSLPEARQAQPAAAAR